eukprot:Tamp_24185.p1 GENE.Tamp_24185~~Tamp_24185.p1  ORF type:complete len:318 (-),score=42.08 Tamp_24185:29-982(-)
MVRHGSCLCRLLLLLLLAELGSAFLLAPLPALVGGVRHAGPAHSLHRATRRLLLQPASAVRARMTSALSWDNRSTLDRWMDDASFLLHPLSSLLALPFLATIAYSMPVPVAHVAAGSEWWALFAHGCSGALGGLAALFGNSALSATLGESNGVMQGLWITAVTKAINAVTYAYIRQAIQALPLGAIGIILAAAGTGIVATLVSSAFDSRPGLFRENVVRNVLAFEAFWLTYAAIGAISPACSVRYVGVAIAGALGGLASSLVSSIRVSWQPLEGGLRGLQAAFGRLRPGTRRRQLRAAFESGILNVVYMAVFWTLNA